MVGKYYGFDDTPATVNKDLKDATGFVGGGLYVWGKYPTLRKGIKETMFSTPDPLTDAQYAVIKQALGNGYPVMLQIDYNPKTVPTDTHYVLVIGYDEGDENNLTIADPLGGTIHSLKDYLGWYRPSMRKTIEQVVVYEGKVPAQSGALPPDFPDLVNKATKWDGTVREVLNIKDRAPQNVDLDELKRFVGTLKDEKDNANRRLSNIKNEEVDGHTVNYYITELDNREEQVKRLKVENNDLQVSYDRFKVEVSKGSEVAEAQRKADTLLIYKLQGEVEENGKTIGKLNHDVESAKQAQATAENTATELEAKLKQAQTESVASLTVYDALELVITKVVNALKGTKLK